MRVAARSRKARSCETTTTAAGVEATKRSSRSSPAKSRSFVGSSRRKHVEPGEEERRERGARGLASREVSHRQLEPVGVEPDVGARSASRRAELVAADSEEPLERVAVGRDRCGVALESGAEGVELGLGGGDAGSTRQITEQRSRPGPPPAPVAGSRREAIQGSRPHGRRQAPRARRGGGGASSCRRRSRPRPRSGCRGRRRGTRGRGRARDRDVS